MKTFLPVLKFTLLAALLIGLTFGYLFFRVWQKNESPTLAKSSWSATDVLLGHAATLTLKVDAPWHREIEDAAPFSHPDFLAPVPDKATVTKGALSFTGTRTWTLTVPFVATDTKSLEGLTATFPIKSTKRISPTSITATLPALTITTPNALPETPRIPETFLTESKPPEDPAAQADSDKPTRTWLWVLLALLLIPVIIYSLKRAGLIKTTPPWEKALGSLAKLDPTTEPIAFYSKLTDILRQYTADRFNVRARSKTSAEFLAVLRNHPQIPKQDLDQLTSFANLADAVKFADHLPDPTKAPQSLELIRTFVTNTTPVQEEKEQN